MNNFWLVVIATMACAITGITATLGVAFGNFEGFRLLWLSLVSLACLPLTAFMAWCAYQERAEN